jgi:hypothetical protein
MVSKKIRSSQVPGRILPLLVVGQIGLATTLLYASGLILQSFSRVVTADVGFSAARLTAVTLPNLSTRGMESLAARAEYERYRLKLVQTVERLRAVRGVAHAASTDGVPMDRRATWPNPLQPEADRSMSIEARTVAIGLGYPKMLGVPLIEGAEPSQEEADAIGSHGVGFALANVSLAS